MRRRPVHPDRNSQPVDLRRRIVINGQTFPVPCFPAKPASPPRVASRRIELSWLPINATIVSPAQRGLARLPVTHAGKPTSRPAATGETATAGAAAP
jgi:hypothetical protein